MRKSLAILGVVFWFLTAAVLFESFWPREREIIVRHFVPTVSARTQVMRIRIGEQMAEVEVPYESTNYGAVLEKRTVPPTRDEYLRLIAMSVVAAILLPFFGVVLASYGKCLWRGTAPSKVLEIQAAATTTFLMGVFGGLMSMPPPSVPGNDSTISAGYDPQPATTRKSDPGPPVFKTDR